MTQTKAELLQTKHQGDIRFGDANSSHYVGFKAPATVGSNLVWTLPAADGSANQYLKTDGSGTLSWGSDSTSDPSKMPLAGGTFTGDVTFTGDASNGLWDKSANAFVANLTGNVTGDLTGTATNATHVYLTDNENTNENNLIPFVENGASSTGNHGLEMDGDLTYTPVLGRLTATQLAGTLVTAAQTNITSLGTLTGLTINGGLSLTGANYDAAWVKSADTFRFQDSTILGFGASDDLKIYHDGSHSRIVEGGTGYLKVQSGQVAILNADDSEQMAQFYADGAVELYHNNVKKLETTSGGANVVGALTVNGAALAGGGYASVQYFTTSATWTKPSGIKIIKVYVIGGGGGGGKANGIYSDGGDGGGAGGCAIETIDVTSVSSVSVTIGSGGSGTSSTEGSGSAGGTSSFGSYCSASGGSGGYYTQNQNKGGAGSGEGSGGDLNMKGGQGAKGLNIQNHSWNGAGGQAPVYGVVRSGAVSTGNAQGTSLSYGSGGGGQCAGTSQSGSPGLVVVEEYK